MFDPISMPDLTTLPAACAATIIDLASEEYKASYLRVSVQNETDRLNDRRGPENAPFGGWRNTAVENIAAREGMNPYTLDRIIREDNSEEAPIDVIPALTPDVLDTIRRALADKTGRYVEWLRSDQARYAHHWAGELWQIDRARRALGIED